MNTTLTHQLVCQKEDCLEGKLPVTEVEEVLEGRAQQIDDHRIVVAFGTEPANKRDANTTGECFINFGFVLELRMLGLHRLQLDSHFLARYDVDTKIDVT
jgi:hypothetical protein